MEYKELIKELNEDTDFKEFVALYLDKAINYKTAAIQRQVQQEAKRAISQITEEVMKSEKYLEDAHSKKEETEKSLEEYKKEVRKEIDRMATIVYQTLQKKLSNIIK